MLRLGGPEPHGRRSGVVHVLTDSEAAGARAGPRRRVAARRTRARSTSTPSTDLDLVADAAGVQEARVRRAPAGRGVLDEGTAAELHAKWAPNIVTALGRFGGRTVGVIANNPLRLGGCLDSLSAEKASRFVRMCDAFGVPLIVRGRRARLPARRRPGVGRRRTPRREAAARVRRGRRPAGHAGDPQDLRRRLHRDELPLARRDQGVRLAGRRGRRDGRGRRGPDPAPPQARRGRPRHPPAGRGRAGRRARADRRRRRQGRRDRRRRRGRRAAARPAPRWPRAIADAGTGAPRARTATSRSSRRSPAAATPAARPRRGARPARAR